MKRVSHRRWPFLIVIFLLSAAACRQRTNPGVPSGDFIKGEKGLRYKIICRDHESASPTQGDYLKLQVKQLYKDSVLSDTRDSLPFYELFDSASLSKESFHIFKQIHAGDSLVFLVATDSAFKGKMPAFASKGQTLSTYVAVAAILRSPAEWQVDLEQEKQRFIAKREK